MEKGKCTICNTPISDIESQQFCKKCGSEFIYIPNDASEELKKYIENKEFDCKMRHEIRKKAEKDIATLQREKVELEKDLDKTRKDKEDKEGNLETANKNISELKQNIIVQARKKGIVIFINFYVDNSDFHQ